MCFPWKPSSWGRGALLRRLGCTLFKVRQRLPPRGGFRRLARLVAELYEAGQGQFQVARFVSPGYFLVVLSHALVTDFKQWFGFGVMLLPEQAGAEQAPGMERLPIVGRPLFSDGQASEGPTQLRTRFDGRLPQNRHGSANRSLGLLQFVLVTNDDAEIIERFPHGHVFASKKLNAPGEHLVC